MIHGREVTKSILGEKVANEAIHSVAVKYIPKRPRAFEEGDIKPYRYLTQKKNVSNNIEVAIRMNLQKWAIGIYHNSAAKVYLI